MVEPALELEYAAWPGAALKLDLAYRWIAKLKGDLFQIDQGTSSSSSSPTGPDAIYSSAMGSGAALSSLDACLSFSLTALNEEEAMRAMYLRISLACAALFIALASCTTETSYPPTITPIYAGTDSGLYVFDGSAWTHYQKATSGLASDTVTSLVASGSGAGARIYIGTSNGVCRKLGSQWTSFTTAEGLGGNAVKSLFIDSTVYAASSGGLSSYNEDGTWTNDPTIPSINDFCRIDSFAIVAADSGLYRYNGTSLMSSYPIAPGTLIAGSTKVRTVIVDYQQNIYVGTDAGLAIEYADSILADLGLPAGSDVNDLCLDSNGDAYAACANGLYVLGGPGPVRILSGMVRCVWVDGAGKIYAGDRLGLKGIHRQRLDLDDHPLDPDQGELPADDRPSLRLLMGLSSQVPPRPIDQGRSVQGRERKLLQLVRAEVSPVVVSSEFEGAALEARRVDQEKEILPS